MVPGAWKVAEFNGGGEETRAARALLLEGCGLKSPDIVYRKVGDDSCFGLHGSSGSLSGSSVIISTEVRMSRQALFGGSVMIAVMGYTDARKGQKGHCSEGQ